MKAVVKEKPEAWICVKDVPLILVAAISRGHFQHQVQAARSESERHLIISRRGS
jgi:hypothetical protein